MLILYVHEIYMAHTLNEIIKIINTPLEVSDISIVFQNIQSSLGVIDLIKTSVIVSVITRKLIIIVVLIRYSGW